MLVDMSAFAIRVKTKDTLNGGGIQKKTLNKETVNKVNI